MNRGESRISVNEHSLVTDYFSGRVINQIPIRPSIPLTQVLSKDFDNIIDINIIS